MSTVSARPRRRSETMPVRFEGIDLDDRDSTKRPREHIIPEREPPPLSRRGSYQRASNPRPLNSERRRNHNRPRRKHRRGTESISSEEDVDSDSGYSAGTLSSDEVSKTSRIRNYSVRSKADSDTESEDESDANDGTYAFSLPRHDRRSPSPQSTLIGSDPSLETDISMGSNLMGSSSRLDTANYICRSEYTGEGVVGEPHTAELSVFREPKKARAALFRWIHLEDPSMDFEEFTRRATQTPGLTDVERTGTSKLLRRVRRKFDKPLQISERTKVRYMEPSFLQESLSRDDDPKVKSTKPRTVSWICMPYFFLDGYSNTLSDVKPGAHPMRTLLQARFSMTRKERDLDQAVCNIVGTPKGLCFHIAQIWCLVLGDSLLLTSSRAPLSALQRDSISMKPLLEPSKIESPRILVAYGSSVLWRLNIDECETWFGFLSNFRQFWPRRYRIMYNGNHLTADIWPRILDYAKRSSSGIRLQFQLVGTPKSVNRRILNRVEFPQHSTHKSAPTPKLDIKGDQADAPAERAGSDRKEDTTADVHEAERSKGPNSLNAFHVFTWLNTDRKTLTVNEEQLGKDLQIMDDFLSNGTRLSERTIYRTCPRSSLGQVYALLDSEAFHATDAEMANKKDEREQTMYEWRINIVDAAQTIFQFYFVPTFEGPAMVEKYWGAIFQLLKMNSDTSKDRSKNSKEKKNERHLSSVPGWLETIVQTIQPFKELFEQASSKDQHGVEIPDVLIKSWLHLVMSLIQCTKGPTLWDENTKKANSLIQQGLKKIVQSLNSSNLIDRLVFTPFEVALLINHQYLQNAAVGDHPDISEAYSEYLSSLETRIETQPLERSHQDKLQRLKQEIAVIQTTMEKQVQIFTAIQKVTQTGYSAREAKESNVRTPLQSDFHPRQYRQRDEGGQSTFTQARQNVSAYYADDYDDHHITETGDGSQHSQSQLQPTDPGGYRELLVHDCLEFLHKRDWDFHEMNERATDLEAWNIQKIDTNRDRQESALYAFTIVTVIFLPLSTVASILGMNTADIRNMNNNQWIFWVVALPLTLVIIILSLIWTDELGNFWSAFTHLWKRGRGDRSDSGLAQDIGRGRHARILESRAEREDSLDSDFRPRRRHRTYV